MTKDGKEVILSKEEVVRLHREIWKDMAVEEKLTGPIDRAEFKAKWCDEHRYENVTQDCFLCEYIFQIGVSCDNCPINWGGIIREQGRLRKTPRYCSDPPVDEDGSIIETSLIEAREYFETSQSNQLHWKFSPIEKIANAPLKKWEGKR